MEPSPASSGAFSFEGQAKDKDMKRRRTYQPHVEKKDRRRGSGEGCRFGAVSTIYGVDELSAMCGIGGAYAENVPVFHLVNGRADTHQICLVLKVDRPCHRAAVTSQFAE